MSGPETEGPDPRRVLRGLLRAARSPGENLPQRVVHGGIWTVVDKGAGRGVDLLKTIVLARLLVPEDFGLFGIALLTQGTLDAFLWLGLDAALIQKAEDTKAFLNTAWTLKLVKALAVAVALLLAAPYVAEFFGAPGATALIRFLAVVVVVQGVENVGVVYFRKDLELSQQFRFTFTSTASGAVAAIGAAWTLGSAWALMVGLLVRALVRTILSYVLHSFRPRLDLRRRRVGDLIDFGKWMLGARVFGFGATQGDDILVGRALSAGALGVYQLAYRLSNAVATEVSHAISSVTFPAFSKLQDESERLRSGFTATVSVTASLVVPLSVGLILFIPDFVRFVLGDKWVAAVIPVQILAVAGLLRALSACWGPLYLSRAQTHNEFWKQMIRAVLTLAPALPLVALFGIEGMAFSVVLGISGALIYDLWWSSSQRQLGIGLEELARAVAGPSAAATAAALGTLGVAALLDGGLASFLGLATVFVALYVLGLHLARRAGMPIGLEKVVQLAARV